MENEQGERPWLEITFYRSIRQKISRHVAQFPNTPLSHKTNSQIYFLLHSHIHNSIAPFCWRSAEQPLFHPFPTIHIPVRIGSFTLSAYELPCICICIYITYIVRRYQSYHTGRWFRFIFGNEKEEKRFRSLHHTLSDWVSDNETIPLEVCLWPFKHIHRVKWIETE